MNSAPLDHDVVEGYKQSDVFQILIVGMFIYITGSSIASVSSTFIKDVSILMNALSLFTLILYHSLFYLIFFAIVFALSKLVYTKIKDSDFAFSKLMWSLIVCYFVVEFISFVYTAWGYDMIGIDFLEKVDEYYSAIRNLYRVNNYVNFFRFSPFIFCPLILLYFSKKLKN